MSKKNTTEYFIKKAKEIHGDKYDYSKVEYVNNKTLVTIICKKHGCFSQRADKHLMGQGCPFCSGTMKGTSETFISKSKSVHGDKYDYSKVQYINSEENVCIICPEHGEFWQTPHNHLKGKGCPICSKAKTKHKKFTKESFIEESVKVHGDKYDYSKSNYVDMNTKTCIICKKHGEFWQTPFLHLKGSGCKLCSCEVNGFSKRKSSDEFIESAKMVHGDKYDYSETVYLTAKNKVKIICPIHGAFYQSPWKHISGSGCPKCVHHVSKSETEIFEYVGSIIGKENVVQSERNAISPKEIDIYIPSLKTGIEYNGLMWHTEKYRDKDYHLSKLEIAKKKGIRLIQIFEDEYTGNKELILKKVRHIIGLNDGTKISGRKCQIHEIGNEEAKEFLNRNHLQGYHPSTLHIGAYHEGKLVAVMSFKKEKSYSNEWELTRFASDSDYRLQGVGGKLFSYFTKNYNPEKVKSFADRRWTTDEKSNMYIKIGFKFDGYTPPDYRYFNPLDGVKRQHKFGFRKDKLNKKYGLPISMTENEMTKKLGYEKIYDCGLIRYIWKKAE